MIRLPERLQIIANNIEKGESVADIGTDHGYLPIYLIKNNISDKVILTDINKGPMDMATKNLNQYGVPLDHYMTRIGSGLEPIQIGEVDTAVIAGMGGLLIRDILSDNMKKSQSIKKIILQPRNAQDKLREWLSLNGFEIVNEYLVREGNYICEIITVQPGTGHKTKPIYYEISEKLIQKKDPLLEEFIIKKINTEKKILKHTSQNNSEKSQIQYEQSTLRIKELEEVLSYAREYQSNTSNH